jgi:hypothetical protein
MQDLLTGNSQDWQFGIEASLPIGFRKPLSGVRYAQLDIARERELLREQELEISHQLGSALREADKGAQLIRTNYQYYLASKHEVAALQAVYEAGLQSATQGGASILYVLLQAQRRVAEAEIAYYRALVSYNLAIVDIHYRKGSLLEYNGIWLAEGPWAGKAYFDARRRAQARDAGLYIDYGFTQPKVLSRGPYNQHVGQGCGSLAESLEQVEGVPQPSIDQTQPEEILAPVPEGQAAPPAAESLQSAGSSTDGPKLSATKPSDVRLAAAQIESPSTDDGEGGSQASEPAAAAGQWKSVTRPATGIRTTKTTSDESHSHTTSASGARVAAGWKGMQR